MSAAADIGLWGVPLAVLAGAVRVSVPFLFVSLGECLTERSGRVNLGLEGTLVFGAMSAYAVAVLTGSPWLGVLAAAAAGAGFGALHAACCSLPRVNDIAIGIALMLLGGGLAFHFGKAFIQPPAPDLPSVSLGWWAASSQVRAALEVNVLFPLGVALAIAMSWMFRRTRFGLVVRTVGDSDAAARALGLSSMRVRFAATSIGGALAGIGGASLSLYYPGSWNEGISSGQGLIAVALVIFARWSPIGCLGASLLFGGAGALGPALQSVGVTGGYHLYGAAPYALTLVVLVITSSTTRGLAGAPGELRLNR